MKLHLLFFAFILFCIPVRGQNKNYGFQLGTGFSVINSWMTGYDRIISSSNGTIEESMDSPRIGVGFIMLNFNYFVSPRFSIGLSPQFDPYGLRIKRYETIYHELGVSYKNRIITQRLSYFQIPVTGSFYISRWLSINAGGYISGLISASVDDPEESRYTRYSYYYPEDNTYKYRNADLGITAGLAVELNRLKIGVAYTHGLLNASNVLDRTYYNRSVHISFIFNFVNRINTL